MSPIQYICLGALILGGLELCFVFLIYAWVVIEEKWSMRKHKKFIREKNSDLFAKFYSPELLNLDGDCAPVNYGKVLDERFEKMQEAMKNGTEIRYTKGEGFDEEYHPTE